jgi:hypothetical protein
MFYLIAFILTACVAGFVAAPLFRERRAWIGMPLSSRRARLLEERDTLLRELKDLEFDRHMGKVDDADYADLHAATARKATAVLDALEEVNAPRNAGHNAGRNGAARTVRLSEEVEAEILVARARLRLQKSEQNSDDSTWKCTCGRTMKSSDKFCASCGESRPQV